MTVVLLPRVDQNDLTQAVATARVTVKNMAARHRRDQALTEPANAIQQGLHQLTINLANGHISTPAFIDTAVALLRAAIRQALQAGAAHAAQHTVGLIKAAPIADPTWPDGFDNRYGLYAGTAFQAYAFGFGLMAVGDLDDPDNVVVRWHARPGACVLCAPRDNALFTVGGLPGWPGDGGFATWVKNGDGKWTPTGATICVAGPRCRCYLEYVRISPADLPPALDPGSPPDPNVVARRGQDLALVRAAVRSPDPSTALDEVWDMLADRQAEAQRPYLLNLLRDILTAEAVFATPTEALLAPVEAAGVAGVLGALGGQPAAVAGAVPVTRAVAPDLTKRARDLHPDIVEFRHGWIKLIPQFSWSPHTDTHAVETLRTHLRLEHPEGYRLHGAWDAVTEDIHWQHENVKPLLARVDRVAALRIAREADVDNAFRYFVQRTRPANPDPYADLPSVTPAELKAAQIRAAEVLRQEFDGKPIAVRMREADLAAALRDGRIKTVHETRRSGSLGGATKRYRELRAEREEVLFGIPRDAPAQERPVYGYVVVAGDVQPAAEGDMLGQYGDIQVVLKPSVRGRTTASEGDSIDEDVIPSPVEDPSWESFGASLRHGDRMWSTAGAGRYPEAQIHGGVSVADIGEVVFSSPPSAAVAKQLDDAGIPHRVLPVTHRATKAFVGKCLTCGCDRPDDNHNDPRHITATDLEDAAAAGDITVDEAAANLSRNARRRHDKANKARPYVADIDDTTQANPDYRHVLWTGEHAQLVAMTIPTGEAIGGETHSDTDQTLMVTAGHGEATVGGQVRQVTAGDLVAVPAGVRHNVRNTGAGALTLYTIYAPPEHRPGLVQHVKPVEKGASGGGAVAGEVVEGVSVAGLAVRARDTGRVLMLQRALGGDDPAEGAWEMPGGHLEPGEDPLDGAKREWAEETGVTVPAGEVTGTWLSKDGIYQGFVYSIASEGLLPLLDRDDVTNPDDPDHDNIEAIAWWEPKHIRDNPAVRDELLDSWKRVKKALKTAPVDDGAVAKLAAIQMGKGSWSRHPHPGQRFTHGWNPIGTIRDRVNAAMAEFRPRRTRGREAASAYFAETRFPSLPKRQAEAVRRYTEKSFMFNRRLRAGLSDSAAEQFDVKDLDAAMRPLPDDLLLYRTDDSPLAFGLEEFSDSKMRDLVGTVVRSPAPLSTSLGVPYSEFATVRTIIAAPRGTPSVPAHLYTSNPAELEILLGRDVEVAITRVERSPIGTWVVHAVALPSETVAKLVAVELGKVRLPPGPRDWAAHPWTHGWVWHGPIDLGSKVDHGTLGTGRIKRVTKTRIHVEFPDGKTRTFAHAAGVPAEKPAPKAPRTAASAKTMPAVPRKAATPKVHPPAKPVDIHTLFDADDATIEAALRDVYEGKFGPYTTRVKVYITRAGTRVDSKGREHKVKPSIGVDGDIFDTNGHKIGYFGRSIEPVELHYPDGTVRREVWAEHATVQLGNADEDRGKYQGKGFGGAFNRRAIEWYRTSGVHGISQSDHNGYVWASQGFNFHSGIMPDYKQEELQSLVAALRARKTKNKWGEVIPKRLRDAPDLDAQIREAEALLARLATTTPGEPGYPTAYEVSQLGRRGRRGKTAIWLGRFLRVPADEMILNPDEGEILP